MNKEFATRLGLKSPNISKGVEKTPKVNGEKKIIKLPKQPQSSEQFVEVYTEEIKTPVDIKLRSGKFTQQLSNGIGGTIVKDAFALGGDAPIIRSGDDDHITRVSPLNCETIYIREGMVYGWINKLTGYQLASKPEIVCGNSMEQKQMDDIISKGELRQLLKRHFNHKYTYGNFILRWVKKGGKIVGVAWIDPKYFDALRNAEGKVKYGEDGKPVGYLQYLKWSQTNFAPPERLIEQSAPWPYQPGTGMRLNRDEIVHFKLNEVGDSWWGVGIIEPIYNFVRVKQNADEGFGEMLQRTGFPRIMAYVGDETHPPTQEQIDDVWDNLHDLHAKHQFVGPHYYKFEILESNKPDRFRYNLQYLQDGMVAGLGGPKAFITGLAGETNRATLGDQKLWLERELKNQQEDCSAQFEEMVLAVIAEEYNFSTTPKIVWKEISMESLQSQMDRLVKLASVKIVRPTVELLRYIEKLENFPEGSLTMVEEPEKEEEPKVEEKPKEKENAIPNDKKPA